MWAVFPPFWCSKVVPLCIFLIFHSFIGYIMSLIIFIFLHINIRFSQSVNWRNCLLSVMHLPQLWTRNTRIYLWLLFCLIWTRISFCGNAMLLDSSRVLLYFRIISMVPWALFIFYMYVSFLDMLLIIWYILWLCELYWPLPFYLFPISHNIVQANFILASNLYWVSECWDYRFLPLTLYMIIVFIFCTKNHWHLDTNFIESVGFLESYGYIYNIFFVNMRYLPYLYFLKFL